MGKVFLFAKGPWFVVAVAMGLWAADTVSAGDYVIGQESKQMLEMAGVLPGDHHAVFYHLGKIYLSEGRLEDAVGVWARYLTAAPEGERADAIRERLTILKLKLAARYARQVAEGMAPAGERTQANTVAVLNFGTSGGLKLRLLSKGMTAMIITDLSKIEELVIVEREKMAALLNEIRLGETGLVDSRDAAKLGRFLLARHVVRGRIETIDSAHIDVLFSTVGTQDAMVMEGRRASGEMARFFEIEKAVVIGILADLGFEELSDEVKKALKKPQTKNIEALLDYARGLDHMDAGRFEQARDAFQGAVEADPSFGMAEEALMATPDRFMSVDVVDMDVVDHVLLEDDSGTELSVESAAVVESGIVLNEMDVVEAAQNDVVLEAMEKVVETPPEVAGELPGFPGGPTGVKLGAMEIR